MSSIYMFYTNKQANQFATMLQKLDDNPDRAIKVDGCWVLCSPKLEPSIADKLQASGQPLFMDEEVQ
jgi:hypothetical protein